MKRREFITLVGGAAAAWPLAAGPIAAKPVAGKVARIGVLGTSPWPPFDGLREGLRELGYVEDKNLIFEYRWNRGQNCSWTSDYGGRSLPVIEPPSQSDRAFNPLHLRTF
jgi:hypothetical protein